MSQKPVVLIIRDGWGANHDPALDAYDAIKIARTPCADALTDGWPRAELAAHGRDVGLPEGIMGNSEVGHQNIGAGRIVDQEIVRIDKAFESGEVACNTTLQQAFAQVKAGGKLHLMGLCSDAGVHAMLRHLYGLIALAHADGVERLCIHAFTDGRDTAPTSGLGFVKDVETKCKEIGLGEVVSVTGRYWAMDRDKRWDRVQLAYDTLTGRNPTRTAASAREAIQHYYDNPAEPSRKGDEFITPTLITGEDGQPRGVIESGDAVIFFNFRGDRPRELTRAFIDPHFKEFDRGKKLDLSYVTMTEYEAGLCGEVLFRKPPKMESILGSYVAQMGIAQFRCAETEKFPHVTFFFNDYREEPFDGEERELIPSPKEVSTYDQKPEMSAPGIAQATVKAIQSGKYGFLVVNFANPDMVGHTGSLDAAVKACETVDACVADVLEAVDEAGGIAVITADHGNADQMVDPKTNSPHTQHTLNPVELVIYGEGCANLELREKGRLADIAPTLLDLMDLRKPAAMTGESLITGGKGE